MSEHQIGLFDNPKPAPSRAEDPDTSKSAAQKVDTKMLESMVLYALSQNGPSTTQEIGQHLGKSLVTISPRMKPLESKGKIQRTLERRKTASGATAIVWRIL